MGYLTVTKPSSEMPESSAANHSTHASTAKSPLMHHMIAPFPFGQLPPCLLKLGLAQCSQPHRGPLSLSTVSRWTAARPSAPLDRRLGSWEHQKCLFPSSVFAAFPLFFILFFIIISSPIYSLSLLVRHRVYVYMTFATISLSFSPSFLLDFP